MPRTHAVGGRLPLGEAHERLDLPGEAVAGGQDRQLAAEVLGVPVQGVAEQHGGLVVEVVAGDEHVVAALERRRRRTGGAWRARRPSTAPVGRPASRWGCRSRRCRGGRPPAGVRPRLGGEVAGVACPTRRCSRRCRGRRRGRRPGSRARRAGPTRRGSPCRRTRRPGPGRRGSIMRELVDRLGDLAPALLEEVLGAEVGVVAPDVDDRRALADDALHSRAPGDDRPDLDRVVVVEGGVAGDERVAPDDQDRLPVEVEAGRAGSTTVIGPGTSSSRRGLRSRTFTPPMIAGPGAAAGTRGRPPSRSEDPVPVAEPGGGDLLPPSPGGPAGVRPSGCGGASRFVGGGPDAVITRVSPGSMASRKIVLSVGRRAQRDALIPQAMPPITSQPRLLPKTPLVRPCCGSGRAGPSDPPDLDDRPAAPTAAAARGGTRPPRP